MNIVTRYMMPINKKFSKYVASLILFVATIGLSGCKVNPSFFYAFGGTWVLLAIAFFIATSVTKKNDDHHGHKH